MPSLLNTGLHGIMVNDSILPQTKWPNDHKKAAPPFIDKGFYRIPYYLLTWSDMTDVPFEFIFALEPLFEPIPKPIITPVKVITIRLPPQKQLSATLNFERFEKIG